MGVTVMAGKWFKQPSEVDEPKPRIWHYAGAVGGDCFIFAGRTVDFLTTKEELASTTDAFGQCIEQWRALKTTGSPPKGLHHGGCCVSPSGDLYVYGGKNGSVCHGGLYKLTSLEWTQLTAEADTNGPMKKYSCQLVCFNGNEIIVIFGGHGLPRDPLQPGSSFITDRAFTDGSGFTNEIHFFDTNKCKLVARNASYNKLQWFQGFFQNATQTVKGESMLVFNDQT